MAPEGGILDGPAVPAGRTERYGALPHQVYEVFGSGHALVVLVHGGFWRAAWDRTHLRPLARALARQGYAVALPEYARSGMPGGGWPATGQDCAAALAAVRSRECGDVGAGGDGASGADRPVALVGHSAGGHLAVWLLHQQAALGVVGAVSLAGCLDLHLTQALGLDDDAASDLMGCLPADDPAAWDGADPSRLGPSPYPVVVVHGSADERVPPRMARSWWERAGTPGRDRLVMLETSTHFPLIDPEAAEFSVLTTALGDLFEAH